MRYMMLIYTTRRPATPEEVASISAAHKALMDETERLGILYSANPLERAAAAIQEMGRDLRPAIAGERARV